MVRHEVKKYRQTWALLVQEWVTVMRWLNHIRNLEQNSWKHENFKGGTMMNVNGTMIIFDGSVNNACGTMYNAYKTMWIQGSLNYVGGTVNLVVETTIEKLQLMEPWRYLMVEESCTFGGWILNKANGTRRIIGGTMNIIGGTVSNGHRVVEPYKESWTKFMEPWRNFMEP